MQNLIESISNYFSDEFKSQLANSLDETQEGITKAFSAIIPLSLQKLATIGENGSEGENEIMRITSDAAQYYSHSPNLSDLHNAERGSDLPLKIFGNEEHDITKRVAVSTGIKEASADHLMTLTLPVIAGKLGNYFMENKLSGSDLSQFLSSKKEEISSLTPLGFKTPGATSNNGEAIPLTHVPAKKKMFPTWVMYTVIILVVLLLVYLSRR